MKSHEARLAALEAAQQHDIDLDALGAAIGLTAAEVAEAKQWTASLPPGLSTWEIATLAGEDFGLDPADVLAEAERLMEVLR